LPPGAISAFEKYSVLLEEKGKNTNLTAIKGEDDTVRFHFLDSLALLGIYGFKEKSVIDVGSGAGFPGVPVKIAEPSVDLTLIDSTGKKVAFLIELCNTLSIKAECIHARAEDALTGQNMRERYDIAVSRAVARLNVLCEICLPFVDIGGTFLAMKGSAVKDELIEAHNAIETLGGKILDRIDYKIPGTDIIRSIVLITKTSATPVQYPRRFSKIRSKPL